MAIGRRDALILGSVGAGAAAAGALFGVLALQSQSGAADLLAARFSDLDGAPRRLLEWQGKALLCNFWATWCAPCRDEMPALETLARELGPRGLAVVGVNYKESKREVQAFVQEQKLGFPVLLDDAGQVARHYQVFALPVTVLVDRQGIVAGTALGIRDWVAPDARAYLDRLLTRPKA
jgi:thiol-disulfide isomerase/thioredoxin